MKKAVYVLLVSFSILFVSCTSGKQEQQTRQTESRGGEQNETKNKTRIGEREEEQYSEVIDGTGVSRQLKLGEVDGEDVGVNFHLLGFVSDYSQILDGHYYYLRTDGSGNYTVYQDKGKKVMSFIISDNHYVEQFVKYGDEFYAFVKADDFSPGGHLHNSLVSIDVKTGNVTDVKDMTVEIADDEVWWSGAAFYKGFFYYEDYSDYYGESDNGWRRRGRMASLCLDKSLEKKCFPLSSRLESMKERPELSFIDGKIYYGDQQYRTVTLFSYDLGSGEEEEVLRYERTDYNWKDVGHIKIDQDYIYCQDYMIPRKGGKMLQMPKNISSQNFTPDGKYLLYLDGKSRLHRISWKSRKDVVICADIKIDGIDCTEEGIYVREDNEAWLEREDMESWDDWADPRSNNVYYMDFDGKNRRRICKEVTELND